MTITTTLQSFTSSELHSNQSMLALQQAQFCSWMRAPSQPHPVKLAASRLAVYRKLIFNNICNFIDRVFPVSRALLGQQIWQPLLNDFVQYASCHSPFFHDISLQFREYLQDQQQELLIEFPWLFELLHYEWLELYLDTVELPLITEPPHANQTKIWQLKTQVWVLVYHYPVYQWQVHTPVTQCRPQPGAILVWRDVQHQFQQQVLSSIEAVLIEQLQQVAPHLEELQAFLQQTVPQWSETEYQQQIDALQQRLTDLELLHQSHHQTAQ